MTSSPTVTLSDVLGKAIPAVLCSAPNETVLQMNAAAEQRLGLGKDDCIGKSFASITPAENGFEIESFRIEESDGNTYVLKTVRDRSKETSRAYRFLDSIVENIPDMIFVKDAKDLRFILFNKAGEDLLGYPRESLIGKNDYDFFPKSEADAFTSKDRSVLAEKVVVDITEEPIHTRLRGERVLRTKKIPICDENGEPEYLLGISEDITEKKQAERTRAELLQEQIEKKEAQKGIAIRDDFISVASHELRTPLTTLKIQLQLLPRLLKTLSFEGKDRFIESLDHSMMQLDQFTRWVDELLDVSRIHSGHLVLNKKPVDLSAVVAQVLTLFQKNLQRAGCTLVQQLEPARGSWDPVRIEQIFINLLTNALKYGAGKPIEVSVRTHSDHAELSVLDHGIGIDPRDHQRIFERFERATPVTQYGGLGLGLYITKQLAEAHGGSIRVESETGRGARFVVVLPIDSPNHDA